MGSALRAEPAFRNDAINRMIILALWFKQVAGLPDESLLDLVINDCVLRAAVVYKRLST